MEKAVLEEAELRRELARARTSYDHHKRRRRAILADAINCSRAASHRADEPAQLQPGACYQGTVAKAPLDLLVNGRVGERIEATLVAPSIGGGIATLVDLRLRTLADGSSHVDVEEVEHFMGPLTRPLGKLLLRVDMSSGVSLVGERIDSGEPVRLRFVGMLAEDGAAAPALSQAVRGAKNGAVPFSGVDTAATSYASSTSPACAAAVAATAPERAAAAEPLAQPLSPFPGRISTPSPAVGATSSSDAAHMMASATQPASVGKPMGAPSRSGGAGTSGETVDEECLLNMGFDAERVRRALAQRGGEGIRALDLLISSPSSMQPPERRTFGPSPKAAAAPGPLELAWGTAQSPAPSLGGPSPTRQLSAGWRPAPSSKATSASSGRGWRSTGGSAPRSSVGGGAKRAGARKSSRMPEPKLATQVGTTCPGCGSFVFFGKLDQHLEKECSSRLLASGTGPSDAGPSTEAVATTCAQGVAAASQEACGASSGTVATRVSLAAIPPSRSFGASLAAPRGGPHLTPASVESTPDSQAVCDTGSGGGAGQVLELLASEPRGVPTPNEPEAAVVPRVLCYESDGLEMVSQPAVAPEIPHNRCEKTPEMPTPADSASYSYGDSDGNRDHKPLSGTSATSPLRGLDSNLLLADATAAETQTSGVVAAVAAAENNHVITLMNVDS